MSEWQCSWCEQVYSFDEFMVLGMVKAVESDDDPASQHGYVSVCCCGKRFHLDTWRLFEALTIERDGETFKFGVSTVHLECDPGFRGKKLWYETLVLFFEQMRFDFRRQYSTREGAIQGHTDIVAALRSGKFHFKAETTRFLEINL